MTKNKNWIWLPGIVTTFLIQHAVQGWCPPLPVFRKLGYRTKDEIHKEKYALKLLRGDFDKLGASQDQDKNAEEIFKAVSVS